jgi:AbrB family looped-hinge helix DNA binding protein
VVEEKMRYVAKLTSKGQVTIPKPVRDHLGLAPGDYLVFEVDGDRLDVTKAPVAPTEDFEALAERIAQRFEERGISRDDVAEAIRWARQEKDASDS